jgi:hypothetical protein
MMRFRLWLVPILALGTSLSAPALAETARSIAVFDPVLVNTSPAESSPAELDRLKRLGDSLRRALAGSGQYRLVAITPVRDKVAAGPALRDCPDCAIDLGKELGAELSAVAWVQKVSDLILNINIRIADDATGRIVKAGSVDIRGNTDESWDRGLKFLLEEHVFGDRP